ncbi:MAG: hypothetical protein BWY45_02358 [Euryarchaeota archaeon ADurb.Bin294]|jgi:uncharacterized Zn finger protein|nr:MAG: hypothetical protein BWY45_02358 [Euryarchaeota archaeon ADurb.Bin294]
MRRRKNRWWINSIHDVPDEKKITLKAQDGPVGKSWYARDFVRAMEAVAEKKRLARGLNCARNHEASRLVFKPGWIKIGISCSGYTIRDVDFSVTQFRQPEWDTLIKTIASDASLSGALVSGEFSEHFVDELRRVGIDLLPSIAQGFHYYCNCGDHHDPCIHKIAARYFVAEALDDDPWLLLYIRGKSRDDVLNAVRQVKSVQTENVSRSAGIPVSGFFPSGIKLPEKAPPTGFFTCEGDDPLVPLQRESVRIIPIRLLGKSPYYFGRQNMADAVIELYPHIFTYAESILPDEKKEGE